MADADRDLPLPVAALLRRSRNAKSPRDRHDAAYYAWEVAIRLAIAARPPADASSLVRPAAGHWVAAMQPGDGRLDAPAVRALHGHLTEAALGRRASPQSVLPREVLDALVAYRNKVIGHGASTRPAEFYAAGAAHLVDGLAALWAAGVFLPPDARVFHVESVEEDEQRRRRARLLELRAGGPEILDPAGTPDVPESVVKGRVVLRTAAGWTDLFPWVLYRADGESTLFYNASPRQPEYLDFASGEVLRGADVEEIAPGAGAALAERLRATTALPAAPSATAPPPGPGEQPAEAPDPLLGHVIQGQYRLDSRPWGKHGGYVATDLTLDRPVIVKLIREDAASDSRQREAFLRVGRALSRIQHLNVIRLLAAGVEDGRMWYALESVEGRAVHEIATEDGPIPWPEACDLAIQACRGLAALHERRILHRDVKPGNLVVMPGGLLKIVDLEIAEVRDDEFHRTALVVGTPYYLAPEQFTGDDRDGRTDIYALGATLYFALTGERPHVGAEPKAVLHSIRTTEPKPIPEFRPDLPPALWGVVRRMIDRDPEKRFATCGDVIAALEPILRAASVPAEGDPRRFGDFELLGKLGEGGMGVVFLARQRSLDRVVALKMLPPGASDDSVTPARFRREMTALSRCDHPNVVKILASGDEHGRLWYAMEFVEGADLAAVAGELSTSSGLDEAVSSAEGKLRERRKDAFGHVPALPRAPAPLSARRADKVLELAEAMRDAALGLDHLHAAGIIHRDVKPGNLMLTPERRVVVMDLGLAAMRNASRSLTKDKAAILGTLRYMPPEQLQRSLVDVDERSDVYSLGATFYELLTDRPLFDTAAERALIASVRDEPLPPRKANPRLPEDLATIDAKCIAKDPRERYRSARAVADDLQAFLDGRPIAARPPSFTYYVALAVRRNRPLAAAVAGIVVVLAAALAVSLSFLDRANEATARATSAGGAKDEALRQVTETAAREREALRRARVLGLTAASQAMLTTRPMRALLLAREAVRTDGASAAAVNTLRDATSASFERVVLHGHRDGIRTAAFSPDGTKIVTASADGTACVWDWSGKRRVDLCGHTGEVRTAAFSRDGTKVVTASDDKTARVWGLDGGAESELAGHARRVLTAAFSPDGRRVVTASEDGTARIWLPGAKDPPVLLAHTETVRMALFSADGTQVVTASDDRTARVWDLRGKVLADLRGHGRPVLTAAFSPDGSSIVTASTDATARVWDLRGGLPPVDLRHDQGVLAAAFSPDGTKVVTASKDRTARVWDLGGNVLADLRGHGDEVRRAAFSPDGQKVVTASVDRTARVWVLGGGDPVVLSGHGAEVWSAAFSPDGTSVLTASGDRTARIWDLSSADPVVLRANDGEVRTAAFSPDGARIVTASVRTVADTYGTARVWDLRGNPVAVLHGHEDGIETAAFSPDGANVVTGSWDRTARVWDVDGGGSVVLRGHDAVVRTAAFSGDGSRVLTAADDGSARLWFVRTGDLLRLADSRVSRDFTDEERKTYADLLGDDGVAKPR